MPLIGNQLAQEKIQDHRTYTGDGSRTAFGVQFEGGAVLVFQNGIKLKETQDYTVDSLGTHVIFTEAPVANDTVDLFGTSEITDLSRSTYVKQTYTATLGQTNFQLSNPIAPSDRINVYVNGLRLSEVDYTIDYTNKMIIISARHTDDIVMVETISPGFRSSMHNAKNDKATHPMFASPDQINNDITIPSGENAMLVGPVTLNGVITLNGTLTVV